MNAKGEKTDRDDHIYDFRHSAWFVDAATSPKDLVILLDASGSMTGQRSQLAAATVREILDTLGSNDYVNVFKFSDFTEEIVPCFKDLLVQASPENKRDLKNALDTIRPENIANFTSALVTAFEILHKVRNKFEISYKLSNGECVGPTFLSQLFVFTCLTNQFCDHRHR